MLEQYAKKDSRFKYVILGENKGISGNTNAAMDMATGDYIVLADHDDKLTPNALYECAKLLQEHPDATASIRMRISWIWTAALCLIRI